MLDAVEKHKEHLRGVDIMISAVHPEYILAQKLILQAAKEVGVKRVVPCDFGTVGDKGIRILHDQVRDTWTVAFNVQDD